MRKHEGTRLSICDRLKAVVDDAGGLTRAAEASGVPYRTLQNYIGGQRKPQAEILAQVCTRLGVSGDWLLTGVGEMYPRGDRVAERGDPGACYTVGGQQLRELKVLLGRLAEDTRRVILLDAIARAEQAAQLDDLRKAVDELSGKPRP